MKTLELLMILVHVFLNVSPNRLQFFIRESLSLICVENGRLVEGWTVMKHGGGHNLCRPGLRDFGTMNGSSVFLSDLGDKDTSFYWCEDKDGQMSEYTTIRIEDHAILDIPALPVLTGSDLTLRCKMRNGSTIPAFFYINGSLSAAEPKEEFKISNVQKSDEGAYSCTLVTYGRSPMSFLRVRDPPSAAPPPPPPPLQLQVSLNVTPNLQQFFGRGPAVSVSCLKDGKTVEGWTVKRTIENKTLACGAYCSMSERFIGSACVLNTYMIFTGVYWCESRTGLKSDQATITITGGDLILEIPALPVLTGSDVTLRCRNRNGETVSAYFFKNNL
uniref:Ig-like domain-containing protein n=1 Tax=Anabas testudineus TaxID=64144 RepID=A0A7N6FDX2_ANATE